MSWDRDLAMYVAVYDSVDSAEADLGAIERLHKEDLIGTFDAAVIDKKDGKAHIAKRMSRPMVRIIPEAFGGGRLARKELKEAAEKLQANEAGLIMVGEPTLDRAFDKAVTHTAKTVKSVFDATADEFAEEMKAAVGS